MQKQKRYDGAAVLSFVVVATLLVGAAFQRNKAFETLLSLWKDAAEKSPFKSRPHNNLGNCYMLLGRYFEAIEEYKKAIALDSNNIEAYYNIAMNLDNVGIFNQAYYYYDIFYKRAPDGYSDQKKVARKRMDAFLKQTEKTGQ